MIMKWIMFIMYLVLYIVFHSPAGHKLSEQTLHQNFKLTQNQTIELKDRKLSLYGFYCGQK